MKKKLISVLIFVALIIFGFIVGFKYAINYNLQLVSGYANIANWSLGSILSNFGITLLLKQFLSIAPVCISFNIFNARPL